MIRTRPVTPIDISGWLRQMPPAGDIVVRARVEALPSRTRGVGLERSDTDYDRILRL